MGIATYVSPTSWTDQGMDWGQPDAQKAVYVDAIRLATIERCEAVAGIGSATGLYIRPTSDRLLSVGLLNQIQTVLTGIVTGYVNHTSPLQSYYPYYLPTPSLNFWNVPALMAYLDLPVLYPQFYHRDNTAWISRIYVILNTLRQVNPLVSVAGTIDVRNFNYSTPSGPGDVKWSDSTWVSHGFQNAIAVGGVATDDSNSGVSNGGERIRCTTALFNTSKTAPASIQNAVLTNVMCECITTYGDIESGAFPGQTIPTNPAAPPPHGNGYYFLATNLNYAVNTGVSVGFGDISSEPVGTVTIAPNVLKLQWDMLVLPVSIVDPVFQFKDW